MHKAAALMKKNIQWKCTEILRGIIKLKASEIYWKRAFEACIHVAMKLIQSNIQIKFH